MNLIVAVDRNWGIGCDNKLLAHIPEDMKYFREMTLGKTVVMGRKTFESLPNGALPDRTNVVFTRDRNFKVENVEVIVGEELLGQGVAGHKHPSHQNQACHPLSKEGFKNLNDDVFVIGGAEIYEFLLFFCMIMSNY